MEKKFSNDPRFVEILKRHVRTYLEKTFTGNIRDPPNARISTNDVKRYYERQIEYFRENLGSTTTFVLNFEHLRTFDRQQKDNSFSLSEFIQARYFRFYRTLCESVHKFLSVMIRSEEFVLNNVFVAFTAVDNIKTLRQLKCNDIGELVCIRGTVTRSSIVEPELYLGCFLCMICGVEVPYVTQDNLSFTKPKKCVNIQCKNRDKFQLLIENSQLINHQKVRIQERTDEIPSGMIPRTSAVILRNDMVDMVKPGDTVRIIGTLIVIPDIAKIERRSIKGSKGARDGATGESAADRFGRDRPKVGELHEGVVGLKYLGVGEMTYRLCFLAHYIETAQDSKGSDDGGSGLGTSVFTQKSQMCPVPSEKVPFLERLSQEELIRIHEMKDDKEILKNLVLSIAPTIYGYKEIKEGILLQMIGGVHKRTSEGVKLRGDLNVCIVGDPGVAKSQFLKYVSSVLPRAVYTSGRASSAAGLTVAVVRDSTGEFRIEAGALMLSDNGICCIDEFDKMHQGDQVAIHEAMEQQTISIAKAGIRATLHARTSILAAANPIGGRYDKSKTLRANIGYTLSPAIISRFDLFFIVCDDHDEVMDERVARHILGVHRGKTETKPKYSTNDVRLFIEYVKEVYKPILTEKAMKLLSETFTAMRQRDKVETNAFRVTVRQLESLVRLSEAVARIYCDDCVRVRHVREAIQLLQKTIQKMEISFRLDVPGEGDDGEEDDEAYLREVRMGDVKQRELIYRQIQKNVERLRVDYEKEDSRSQGINDQLIDAQKKSDDLYRIDREIKAGLADEEIVQQYGAEEIQERLSELEMEIDRLKSLYDEVQEKVDSLRERYEKEKEKMDKLWEEMDESLRREIEKNDNDDNQSRRKRRKTSGGADIEEEEEEEEEEESSDEDRMVDEEEGGRKKKKKKKLRRKGRRKKKKSKKFEITQELYQKICQSFLNQLTAKSKRLKKKKKKDYDEAVMTVKELLDGSIRNNELMSEITGMSEERKRKLLKKILTRLITKDNVLVDTSTSKSEFESHEIMTNPNFSGFGY